MAEVGKKAVQDVMIPESVEDLTELTVAINHIASNGRHANGYEIRNAILIEEQKGRVRYKNGVTVLPVSVQQLFANAQNRNYNHRRTLARNLVKVRGSAKPADACAHHVVALNDDRAQFSRKRLFGWFIGINDVDNGVFLPQFAYKPLAEYPDAPQHGPVHSPVYHAAVFARLRGADPKNPQAGRERLRTIKAQLLADTFPR